MKKKLKALPVRIQLAGVGVLLVLLLVIGYMLVVSPQHAEAASVQKQVDAEQAQIYKRRAEIRAGLHPPTIQTADLFRLARAMPDREDMPGIILTLSQVARASGITFDLIEPVTDSNLPTGSYTEDRIHLLFNGDYYGLSDFLYRIRNLVAVHDGNLEASGRLFNIDTLTFNYVQGKAFPTISAELFLDTYVYTPAAPTTSSTTTPPTTTTTTTTTTPTTTGSSSTDSSSVTASGPVP